MDGPVDLRYICRVTKPTINPREVIFDNQFVQVYRVAAQFAEGTKNYYVSDYGLRAGVLLVRDEKILLVQQYRYLADGLTWEIPGGRIETGETPEAAAQRECREEAGLQCTNLKSLLQFRPGSDTCHNPTHVFYGTEFQPVPAPAGKIEEITGQSWIPLTQCLDMILSGEIMENLCQVAILTYHLKKLRHEL